MDMQVNQLGSLAGSNVVSYSNEQGIIYFPQTFDQIVVVLQNMTFNTTIMHKGWTVQMGGRCKVHRGDAVTESSKLWVTNSNGRSFKVCGLDEVAAREVAKLVGIDGLN